MQQGLNKLDNVTKIQKREWVKPRLDRLDTSNAESSHGAIADAGGGNQGS